MLFLDYFYFLSVSQPLGSLVDFLHVLIMQLALLLHQHILVLLLLLVILNRLLGSLELGHHLVVALSPGYFFSFLAMVHDIELVLLLLFELRPHLVHT